MVEPRGSKKVRSRPSLDDEARAGEVSGDAEEINGAEHCSQSDARKRRRSSRKTEDEGTQLSSSKVNTQSSKPARHKRLKGMLSSMMSMPLDIFCEIAHYLGPDDLLRLSRTSNALRELLMSKSSKLIWKNAEQALGMPECPLDLSSPQYASFIFDPFCSHCLKTGSFRYYFTHRVRLCQSCESTSMTSGREFWIPSHSAYDPADPIFHAPVFKAAFPQYFSRSAAERSKFARERREVSEQIVIGIDTLKTWLNANKSMGARYSYSTKASRRDAIYARLRDLGYNGQDFIGYDDENDWKWKSLLEQNQVLTERIWENIFPKLQETIYLRRAKRRRHLVDQRCHKLTRLVKENILSKASNYCFVTGQELVELPVARQVIESDDPTANFDSGTWGAIEGQIRELSESWIRNLETRCAHLVLNNLGDSGVTYLLPETEGEHSNNSAICKHATAFFVIKCSSLREAKTFDELLAEYRHAFFTSMDNYNVPLDYSGFEHYAPSLVAALFRSVDVVASTHADMAALGKSFVCLCCDAILRKLMTWSELVQHFCQENAEFERREERRERMSIATANVNDHDEKTESRLAAYTGVVLQSSKFEDVPELGRWITRCTCDKCKRDNYAYTKCEDCRSLGTYVTFSCREMVLAHSRKKHLKQA